MREFELKNGIRAVYKKNSETPRIALTMNLSINDAEELAGTYSLMTRLLMYNLKINYARDIFIMRIINRIEENL